MLKQPHFKFSCFAGKKLHLGVSGSVAAYKMLELLRAWQGLGILGIAAGIGAALALLHLLWSERVARRPSP